MMRRLNLHMHHTTQHAALRIAGLRVLALALLLPVGGGVAASAHAAGLGGSTQQSFDLSATAEYDTNPAMLPEPFDDPVWMAVVTPGYNVLWSDGTSSLELDASLRLQRPSTEGVVFNREDPSVNLSWQRLGAASELNLSAGYVEASTRFTELEDTGQIFRDATRTNQSLSGSWLYRQNARAAFTLQAQYQDATFDAPEGDTSQPNNGLLNDTESASIGASQAYQASEGVSVIFQAGISRVMPDLTANSNLLLVESELQSLGVGVEWEINDAYSLQVSGSQVWVELDGTPRPSAAWNGDVSFSYESERLKWSLAAAQATTPSGLGIFLENTSANALLSYRLSEVTTWGASASWRENRGGGLDGRTAFANLDNRFGFAEVWLSRDLSERWTIKASYRYREQEGGLGFGVGLVDLAPGEVLTTEGQVVSIALNYQPQLRRP